MDARLKPVLNIQKGQKIVEAASQANANLKRFAALSAILVVTLVACGGSGQSSPAPSGPVPPSTPDPVSPALVSVTFTPTDAEFANPERGFYQATSNLDALTAANVSDAYADGYRLLYSRIDLEAYRDTDIPASYLTKLETAFDRARQGGVKLIIRATYNYPRGETEYRDAQDASLSRVLSHLNQLKPLLRDNADVIAFVQAGFIGAWGEWHTSSNGLTSQANRTQIKDALLDAVPPTRFIQFRYPPYIQDWTPTLPSMTSAVSSPFRVGFHNDCFLASKTDVGTYDDDPVVRANQQRYLDALGDLAPFGGETCNPADDPGATPRTACADILGEGARYNLTYLNDGYYRPLFHNNWTSGGCMAEVRRSMGYRFALVSASHVQSATRGGAFAVSTVVRNTGWARLYNPRPVEVVLRNASTGALRRIEAANADPRRWLPGTDVTETLNATVPADMPVGVYEVWLALPDAGSRIRPDARYAVRLANKDDMAKAQKWDAASGAFALGTLVEVR